MIECFYGELLLNVTPVELSGNKCSHNCAYCFANIQRDDRYSDIEHTVKFLGKDRHTGLVGDFWDNGYALTLSNRTDPFSETNITDTLVLARIFSNVENGIFIQTKLGRREYIDKFLENIGTKRNIVWYITITTPNDDIAKIIEPGAPSPTERMKVAKYLHDLGFTVIVAFNPFVKGWTTVEENGKITDELASYGITHFIYQNLHMRQAQVDTFTEYRKNQFEKAGTDLSRYTVRKNAIEEQRYMQEAVINAYRKGYHAIAFGMPFYTNFYDEIVSSLGKCTPSNYFFYNWVIKNKKAGDEVTEQEYKNILAPYFGEMYNKQYTDMPTYILRWARQAWKGNEKAQGIRTFDELISFVWNDKRISGSPRNNQLFSVEGEKIFYKGGGRP